MQYNVLKVLCTVTMQSHTDYAQFTAERFFIAITEPGELLTRCRINFLTTEVAGMKVSQVRSRQIEWQKIAAKQSRNSAMNGMSTG